MTFVGTGINTRIARIEIGGSNLENRKVEDVNRLKEPSITVKVEHNILISEVSKILSLHKCASKAMARILK